MPEIVIMPKQGLQMTEGTIRRWFVAEGSTVKKGEPLFEVETDKLVISIDAEHDGLLLKILHGEGDVVPITEPIAVIGAPDEVIPSIEAGAVSAERSDAHGVETGDMDYDVAVIGGGPGGYTCAVRAAKQQKKVVLVEEGTLGGTCLNSGCIPTKTLLHCAKLYRDILGASRFGIIAKDISFDYGKISSRKKRTVAKLVCGIGALLRGAGVTVMQGRAALMGANTILVNGSEIKAKNIVLAIGRKPYLPDLPGADRTGVYTSDQFLELETLPESVVIVGGDAVGTEFADLLNAFGVRVTLLTEKTTILSELDAETADAVSHALKKNGVHIFTDAEVLRIEDGLICVYRRNGQEACAEAAAILFAETRRVLFDGLGLELAGVRTEADRIPVDAGARTNVPGIYAVGDVTGKHSSAHAAAAQGKVAADSIAGKEHMIRDDRMPTCIYTTPEAASVGMTSEQAACCGRTVRTGMFPVVANGRSATCGENTGFVKLLSDAETGEILGAHIVAGNATELIGEMITAMEAESTVEELAAAVHPHPTINEMLMEAADDTLGLSCNKL